MPSGWRSSVPPGAAAWWRAGSSPSTTTVDRGVTQAPDYAAKKARVEHLYAIADGEVIPDQGEPEVVFCIGEFGPLNLQPNPGRQWAERGGKHRDPDREPRPRRVATYTRPHDASQRHAVLLDVAYRSHRLRPWLPVADRLYWRGR